MFQALPPSPSSPTLCTLSALLSCRRQQNKTNTHTHTHTHTHTQSDNKCNACSQMTLPALHQPDSDDKVALKCLQEFASRAYSRMELTPSSGATTFVTWQRSCAGARAVTSLPQYTFSLSSPMSLVITDLLLMQKCCCSFRSSCRPNIHVPFAGIFCCQITIRIQL